MAIHPTVPGLRVHIVNDYGNPLPEYAGDDEFTYSSERAPHPRTVKYIEAESGQEIGIETTFAEDFRTQESIECRIFVDGKLVQAGIYNAKAFTGRPEELVRGVTDWTGHSSKTSAFKFSDIDIRKFLLSLIMNHV